MIDEAFLERLSNWRRVYGDRQVYRRSSTFDICQYLRAYADRQPETEEEKYWREADELRYREPQQPSPDYKDADFLQTVWARMPEMIRARTIKAFSIVERSMLFLRLFVIRVSGRSFPRGL